MSEDLAPLAAASATRPLAGRSIRPFDGRAAALSALVASGLLTAVAAYFAWLTVAVLVGFGLGVMAMACLIGRHNAGVREINQSTNLIARGDFSGAERALAPVATGRYTQVCVALALHNLGSACLRGGDLASATPLFRASLALYRKQVLRSLRSGEHLARSGLAFSLAATGDLDAADATLAEPVELVVPQAHATEVLTRALVALRRGDAGGALDVLARSMAFLRNACTGESAALAQAIEASAGQKLEQAGDPYRGNLAIPRRVAVDPIERAYVLGALPGCESVLVDA
jgi:hypothetical protein